MKKEKENMVTVDEKSIEKDLLKSMLRTVFNNDLIDRNIFNKVMSDINRE